MVAATREAVRCRNRARDALAKQIARVVEDVLDHCGGGLEEVVVGDYIVSRREVTQDCSQWSNRVDYPARRGLVLMVQHGAEIRSLARVDLGFFDGSNYQYACGAAYCDRLRVRLAPVRMLTEVARGLPGVVSRLHIERQTRMAEQTRAAQEATATALA